MSATEYVIEIRYDGPVDSHMGPFDSREEAEKELQKVELVIVQKSRRSLPSGKFIRGDYL